MSKELVEKIEKQLEKAEQVWNEYLNEGKIPFELTEAVWTCDCVYSGDEIEEGELAYEVDRMESSYLKTENLRVYLQTNVDMTRHRLEMAKEL